MYNPHKLVRHRSRYRSHSSLAHARSSCSIDPIQSNPTPLTRCLNQPIASRAIQASVSVMGRRYRHSQLHVCDVRLGATAVGRRQRGLLVHAHEEHGLRLHRAARR